VRAAPVLAVAGLAFRESLRNRVLHALIAAMVVMAGVSHIFAYVSGDEPARRLKVVADLSLSAIVLLGTLASIFLGTNLVYQEVERRTIYTVLARPIDRVGFLVGKYVGLAGVMALAVTAMAIAFFITYAVALGVPTLELVMAIVFIYVELAVVIAVALFFSVAAHPIEGAVFAFIVALLGHVTKDLDALGQQLATQGDATLAARALAKVLHVAYVLLPNLENFNLRAYAAHGLPLPTAHLGWAVGYAALYVTILLALSSIVFRRKTL
jgi:Cu-processing system permease protein